MPPAPDNADRTATEVQRSPQTNIQPDTVAEAVQTAIQDNSKPPNYMQACAIAANMLRDLALQKVVAKMRRSFLVSGVLACLCGAAMLFVELFEIFELKSFVCMCTGLPTAATTLLIGLVSIFSSRSSKRIFCLLNSAILLGVAELVLIFVNTINSVRDWFVSDVRAVSVWQAVHVSKFALDSLALGIVFYQVCAYVKHCFNYGEVRSNYDVSVSRHVACIGEEDEFESDSPRFADPPPDYLTVTNEANSNPTTHSNDVSNRLPNASHAQPNSITIVITSEDD